MRFLRYEVTYLGLDLFLHLMLILEIMGQNLQTSASGDREET